MRKKIKWLHISDFHVGKDNYESIKLFKHIINDVKKQKENSFIPDLIFITGDIANKALEKEYEIFITDFIEPLCKVLNITDVSSRIFCVPGNHDLERKFVNGVDIKRHLVGNSNFFNSNEIGREERTIHELRGFKNFIDFLSLSEISTNDWLDSETGTFIHSITLNGIKIGIIGVNTAWLSRTDSDEKNLSIGIDLIEESINKVKNCDLKIVLGHHPLSWFYPAHIAPIETIFSDNNVIYVHGHLHKSRVQPFAHRAGNFIEIQSGAAFDVKEFDSSGRKNGFIWAEVDFDGGKISLQPKYWKASDRRWGISDDLHEDFKEINSGHKDNWWSFNIPTLIEPEIVKEEELIITEEKLQIPEGWEIINEEYFVKREGKNIDELIISFFDGSTPLINRNFLDKLPNREGTEKIFADISQNREKALTSMTLITGAGGEGKTTCLYQSIYYFYRQNEWNILWNQGNKNISVDFLSKLPINKSWLIISDDAEKIVTNIEDILKYLKINSSSLNIHFLLSSRESDWYDAKGHLKDWHSYCTFKTIILGKLNLVESQKIVELWSQYGEKGLKSLYKYTKEDAAARLMKATEDKRGKGDGAFLGGMLTVRIAEGLKDHIRSILLRLKEKKIEQTTFTLLDAFAVIAFMHIEGLNNLSFPIFSQYLFNDTEKNIRGKVITPLGREAAATPSGDYIFTRHSTIAQEARELLIQEFEVIPENIYINLVIAAIEARTKVHIPKYGFWNYDYPEYFLNNEQTYLSIKIAEKSHELLPNDRYIFSNLTKLYRKSGDVDLAKELFYSIEGKFIFDRFLYQEWSIVEKELNNYILSAYLSSTALSDWLEEPVKVDNASIGLLTLCTTFEMLYKEYSDIRFFKALKISAFFGLLFVKEEKEILLFNNFEQDTSLTNFNQKVAIFESGVKALQEYIIISNDLVDKLPLKIDLSFSKFIILLNNRLEVINES